MVDRAVSPPLSVRLEEIRFLTFGRALPATLFAVLGFRVFNNLLAQVAKLPPPLRRRDPRRHRSRDLAPRPVGGGGPASVHRNAAAARPVRGTPARRDVPGVPGVLAPDVETCAAGLVSDGSHTPRRCYGEL